MSTHSPKYMYTLILLVMVLLVMGINQWWSQRSSQGIEHFSKRIASIDTVIAQEEPTLIRMYLIGQKPVDIEERIVQMNTLFEEALNVHIEIKYIEEEQVGLKYHALFAGGADFDIIQVYDGHYNQSVAKKAYMRLTEDMLMKCMPETYEELRDTDFAESFVDGSVYMVPSSRIEDVTQGLVLRSDILRMLQLSEIKEIEEFERYLIKAYELGYKPLYVGENGYKLLDIFYFQPRELVRYDDFLTVYDAKEPSQVRHFLEDEAAMEILKTFKKWQESGFIKMGFIEGLTLRDAFETGECAWYFGKPSQTKGNDVTYIETKRFLASPVMDGFAIKNGTTNAAKSLMLIDMIRQDLKVNELFYGQATNKSHENGSEMHQTIYLPGTAIDLETVNLESLERLAQNLLYPMTIGKYNETDRQEFLDALYLTGYPSYIAHVQMSYDNER